MGILEQEGDVIVSITMITSRGPFEFFHDAFECRQLDAFVADCRDFGWPVWFAGDEVFVFVVGVGE